MKPFSEACERNKSPIASVLQHIFKEEKLVLEIGSGTGQHAVYFAEKLPWLFWQTSDLAQNHVGIQAWVKESSLTNLGDPIEIDISTPLWLDKQYDAIFTANTLHILSPAEVELFFESVGKVLPPNGKLCIYGPFNSQGEYTSPSNRDFDLWLRAKDPSSGIRNMEWILDLAKSNALQLADDFEMPNYNRLLHFQKTL